MEGVTREHRKLLESLGVERVVFPEAEIAEELANRMTRRNLIEFLPIDPDYGFMEVAESLLCDRFPVVVAASPSHMWIWLCVHEFTRNSCAKPLWLMLSSISSTDVVTLPRIFRWATGLVFSCLSFVRNAENDATTLTQRTFVVLISLAPINEMARCRTGSAVMGYG